MSLHKIDQLLDGPSHWLAGCHQVADEPIHLGTGCTGNTCSLVVCILDINSSDSLLQTFRHLVKKIQACHRGSNGLTAPCVTIFIPAFIAKCANYSCACDYNQLIQVHLSLNGV